MQVERPAKLIDPVCGMTVEVARAQTAGLLVEHDGRTYAFCSPGCRRAFVDDPAAFVAVEEAVDPHTSLADHDIPVIDEGIRRWYESCACCLSEAYPEIKAQLDAERAEASLTPVDAGICEVAEAAPPGG